MVVVLALIVVVVVVVVGLRVDPCLNASRSLRLT